MFIVCAGRAGRDFLVAYHYVHARPSRTLRFGFMASGVFAALASLAFAGMALFPINVSDWLFGTAIVSTAAEMLNTYFWRSRMSNVASAEKRDGEGR